MDKVCTHVYLHWRLHRLGLEGCCTRCNCCAWEVPGFTGLRCCEQDETLQLWSLTTARGKEVSLEHRFLSLHKSELVVTSRTITCTCVFLDSWVKIKPTQSLSHCSNMYVLSKLKSCIYFLLRLMGLSFGPSGVYQDSHQLVFPCLAVACCFSRVPQLPLSCCCCISLSYGADLSFNWSCAKMLIL